MARPYVKPREWPNKDGSKGRSWEVKYQDLNGRRRSEGGFKTKKAAEVRATKIGHELALRTFTPESQTITVKEAGEQWMQKRELDGLRRATLDAYRWVLKDYINPLLGHVKLTDLRRSRVKAYRNELLEMGKRPTAEKAFIVLKCVLEEAADNEFVAQNVARAVKIGGKPKRKLIMGHDFPSPQEALQIMDEAKDPFRPLAITALCSGMRVGELRALLWEHLDFEREWHGVIMVRQAAEPKSKRAGPTKTEAGVRNIPIWPNLKRTLLEWQEKCTPYGRLTGFGAPEYKVLKAQELINKNSGMTHRELAELLGISPSVIVAVKKAMPISSNSRRWFVFPCWWNGDMQTYAAINQQFQRLQLKLGMVGPDGKPKYSMHSLRHFFASYLISEGYDPVLIATYLGHTSAKMVLDVYGHFMPGREDIPARFAATERRLFATPKLLQQSRDNELR